MTEHQQPVTETQQPVESILRRLLLGKLPLEHETAMFVLVNVLDFLMTYWMLMNAPDGARFVESNPIAAFFWHHWGPVRGMLFFKLAIVIFVCVISQIIAIRRLETARWLLRVGTLLVAGIVIYSATLYLRHA